MKLRSWLLRLVIIQLICSTMEAFHEHFAEDYKTLERFQIFVEDLHKRLQQAIIQNFQKAAKNPTDYGKEMKKTSSLTEEMSVGSINFCRAEDLMDVKVSIDFLKRIAENAEILRDHFSTLPIESNRS